MVVKVSPSARVLRSATIIELSTSERYANPIGMLHRGLLFDIVASNATVARPVRV
jgi:hypothetical protein